MPGLSLSGTFRLFASICSSQVYRRCQRYSILLHLFHHGDDVGFAICIFYSFSPLSTLLVLILKHCCTVLDVASIRKKQRIFFHTYMYVCNLSMNYAVTLLHVFETEVPIWKNMTLLGFTWNSKSFKFVATWIFLVFSFWMNFIDGGFVTDVLL